MATISKPYGGYTGSIAGLLGAPGSTGQSTMIQGQSPQVQNPYANFAGWNPTPTSDWRSLEDQSGGAATDAYRMYRQAIPAILGPGFESVANIMASRGQVDPMLMNQRLATVDRATQASRDYNLGQATQMGTQKSGALQAIQAAIGQAGGMGKAQIIAEEQQAAQERQRQDIASILLPLFLGSTQMAGDTKMQLKQMRDQKSMARDAAIASVISAALGGAGTALGGMK